MPLTRCGRVLNACKQPNTSLPPTQRQMSGIRREPPQLIRDVCDPSPSMASKVTRSLGGKVLLKWSTTALLGRRKLDCRTQNRLIKSKCLPAMLPHLPATPICSPSRRWAMKWRVTTLRVGMQPKRTQKTITSNGSGIRTDRVIHGVPPAEEDDLVPLPDAQPSQRIQGQRLEASPHRDSPLSVII